MNTEQESFSGSCVVLMCYETMVFIMTGLSACGIQIQLSLSGVVIVRNYVTFLGFDSHRGELFEQVS